MMSKVLRCAGSVVVVGFGGYAIWKGGRDLPALPRGRPLALLIEHDDVDLRPMRRPSDGPISPPKISPLSTTQPWSASA